MAQPIEDFVDPVTNRTLGSLQAFVAQVGWTGIGMLKSNSAIP